jgi:hypothetical protein
VTADGNVQDVQQQIAHVLDARLRRWL